MRRNRPYMSGPLVSPTASRTFTLPGTEPSRPSRPGDPGTLSPSLNPYSAGAEAMIKFAATPKTFPSRITALLSGTLLLVGCLGYRVGSLLPPGLDTIAVPTFENLTTEPLLENVVTDAVIAQIQMEGGLRVVPQEQADSVLVGKIHEFRLVPVRYDRDDRAVPNEYRAVITASYVLEDNRTGTTISQRPLLAGEKDFILGGDLISAKRSALPEAAEDLAHDIVEAIVEAW